MKKIEGGESNKGLVACGLGFLGVSILAALFMQDISLVNNEGVETSDITREGITEAIRAGMQRAEILGFLNEYIGQAELDRITMIDNYQSINTNKEIDLNEFEGLVETRNSYLSAHNELYSVGRELLEKINEAMQDQFVSTSELSEIEELRERFEVLDSERRNILSEFRLEHQQALESR